MPKVISWSSDEAKSALAKRLKQSKIFRQTWESQWNQNGAIVYNAESSEASQISISFDTTIEMESGEVDQGESSIGVNYTFKYLKFLHSQMSANPPSVIVRAASSDLGDRRKADAADRLVRYFRSDKRTQDVVDQATQKTLVRGTGWVKICWDEDIGDVHDFNEDTGELQMKGDVVFYSPSTFDIWVDPLARRTEDIRFIIERHWFSMEEAFFRFPDQKELIKKSKTNRPDQVHMDARTMEDQVEIFEYYEKGMPINGLAGRHAWFLSDGQILAPMTKNPHPHAKLPYHILTDIDVEDEIYGKSNIEYVARIQEMINRFDSAAIDAMQAHGVIRMAVPETTEIVDITNSNYDIIKYAGTIPPHFVPAGQLPPDMHRLRQQMALDIQEVIGINDSMLGVQKRETSGFSQQTAIEAGNMIRRRLFNKYETFVEGIFRDFLNLVRLHWSEARTILVLGKEKAFEAIEIKGADIEGGYDLIVEYGASLPVDPNMRREAIMLLIPMLEKAGVPMRKILSMLKLNDLEGLYDRMQQGEDRQREIFEEMIISTQKGEPQMIEPEEFEDHMAYLEFADIYRNSAEYKYLEDESKQLIDEHIRRRKQMSTNITATGDAATPPQAAAPAAPASADPMAALAQLMPPQ